MLVQAFELHAHAHGSDGGDSHGHEDESSHGGEDKEERVPTFISRGCVLIAGLYMFFLIEVVLHTWNAHHRKEVSPLGLWVWQHSFSIVPSDTLAHAQRLYRQYK